MPRGDNLKEWRSARTKEEISAQASAASKQRKPVRRITSITEAMRYIMTQKPDDPVINTRLEELGMEQTYGAAIALVQADKAIYSADNQSAKFSTDLTDGPISNRVEISGIEGKPIESLDLSKLSDEDLKKILYDRKTAEKLQ